HSVFAAGNNVATHDLLGRRTGTLQWATDTDLVVVHEINHLLDGVYADLGLERYEFNHGIWAVQGGTGRDFEINAQIVRNVGPASLTASDGSRGEIVIVADRVGDGLDAEPLYPLPDALVEATPVIDRIVEMEDGWTTLTSEWGHSTPDVAGLFGALDTDAHQSQTTTRAAWDDEHLYLSITTPGVGADIYIDAAADSWFRGPANIHLMLADDSSYEVRVNVGVPDLFRMIDDDGQWSEIFDTDIRFTRPYRGLPFNTSTTDGAGFPGRVLTENDLDVAAAIENGEITWEIAIPHRPSFAFSPGEDDHIALDFDIGGDQLFAIHHHPTFRLDPALPPEGYRLVTREGVVIAFGDAPHLGDLAAAPGEPTSVDLDSTPWAAGYWILTADGTVHAYGDATDHGSADLDSTVAGETWIALAVHPDSGYWLVSSHGRVQAFGDAGFHGSIQ
ncbi:MAG: hypothetical protein P8N02_17100, partial [Actinomycetota bacterium]|nr:hypothetical protein [Actinomycetota bacterium]